MAIISPDSLYRDGFIIRQTEAANGNCAKESATNLGVVCGITISSIVLTAVLIIIVIFVIKKMKKKEEEPTVDDNMYYGDDDDYDKEEYTAVVDTNDYYQH